MAEIRDELVLDIQRALSAIDQIEDVLTRAFTNIAVDLDTAPVQARLDALDTVVDVDVTGESDVRQLALELDDAESSARDAAAATDTMEARLRDADTAAEGLEGAMRDVERAAEQAAQETREIERAGVSAGEGILTVGRQLRNLAVAAGVGLGLRELRDFIGGAVTEATNLSESVNAVNVVFAEAADQVVEFGQNTEDAVFLAASEFNQLAASTGNLLQGFGLGVQQAADLTIDLTNRAADLASVFNTDVADALGAINAALRGETEAIRRFTGSFSVDEVTRFGQALFGVTGELTDQQRVLAAVEFILQRTAVVQGDAANTADQLANRQRALNERWAAAQAVIGEQFIPVLLDLIPVLTDDLVPAIVAVTPLLAELVSTIAAIVAPIVDVLRVFAALTGQLEDTEGNVVGVDTALGDLSESANRFAGRALPGLTAVNAALDDGTGALDRQLSEVDRAILAMPRFSDTLLTVAVDADVAGRAIADVERPLGAIAESAQVAGRGLSDIERPLQAIQQDMIDVALGAAQLDDQLAGIDPGNFAALELAARGASLGINAVDSAAFEAQQTLDGAAAAADRLREANQRLVDPLFDAVAALDDLEAAEEAALEAAAEFGRESEEFAAAELARGRAILATRTALLTLGAGDVLSGIDTLAAALEIPRAAVVELFDTLGLIDAIDATPGVSIDFDDEDLDILDRIAAFDLRQIVAGFTIRFDEADVAEIDRLRGLAEFFQANPNIPVTFRASAVGGVPTGGAGVPTPGPEAAGLGGGDININTTIVNPTDQDTVGAAAQAANVISSVVPATSRFRAAGFGSPQ